MNPHFITVRIVQILIPPDVQRPDSGTDKPGDEEVIDRLDQHAGISSIACASVTGRVLAVESV
jgi:hypothetical protein